MENSVLTLGEKIVLAARLAAIEHVRQELDAIGQRGNPAVVVSKRSVGGVGDAASGVTDDADSETLSRPLPELLSEVFGRITPAGVEAANPKRRSRRKGAA